jgi:hypothetical protein
MSALGLSISSSKDHAPRQRDNLPAWSSSAHARSQLSDDAHQSFAPVFASFPEACDPQEQIGSTRASSRRAHRPYQQHLGPLSPWSTDEPVPFLSTQTGEPCHQIPGLISSPPWYSGGSY